MTFDKNRLLEEALFVDDGSKTNSRIRSVLTELIAEVARLREIVEPTTDTCPNCRGEREMGEAKCFVCKGTGVVTPRGRRSQGATYSLQTRGNA